MNCNLSCRICLFDVCDVFGLTNLVKHPKYFKGDIPTLLDVFLTNRPKIFVDVLNVDIGSSDFHNYVCVASRAFAPRQICRKITYRNMKNFREYVFCADIENIPFHFLHVFDNIDDIYWAHTEMYLSVLNEHTPLKQNGLEMNKFLT